MKSPKNYLILLFFATTIAGAILAWRQHQELTALRAAALNNHERADWQKRLWDADRRRTDLEKQLADARPALPTDDNDPVEAPPPAGPREGRRNGRANFMAMMEQPEVQRLMALQQKAGLDAPYAALFRSMNLTPEQLDKFKNLLVEKRTAMLDVMSAAREQGINPRTNREAFQKLVADAQAEIDAGIRSTVGDAAFNQYQNYEKTMPQRATVSQLEQRLSYSSTPLTPAQSEQMVGILAATTTSRADNPALPARLPPGGAVLAATLGVGGGSHITNATVNQATGVLAGPQVDALRQLQQEQQAQAELNAAMRTQFQNNRGSPAPTGTATPSLPTPPPTPGGG